MPNYKVEVAETGDASTKEFNAYTLKMVDRKTDPPTEKIFESFRDYEIEMFSEILKELRIMNDNLTLLIQKSQP